MSYTPYRTATQWKAHYAAAGVEPSDQEKIEIDILGTLENVTGMLSANTSSAAWTATAATNTYSIIDAPALANIVGKTVIGVLVAGGTLDVTLITWNDSDFVFSNEVEFSGGEQITVLANV